MSYAREPPQKKRGRNHESPERGKQQKEIICGHVRIPRLEGVGPCGLKVAHIIEI